MDSLEQKLCDTSLKSRYTIEEDLAIWKYIHDRTHDPSDGLLEKFRFCTHAKKFWTDFAHDTGSERTVESLKSRLPKMVKKLHTMPFGVEMKLDLYYSLSEPIHEDFVKDALRCANICMDENRNIEAFEMKEEQPEEVVPNEEKKTRKRRLSASSEKVSGAKRVVRKFTPEEDEQMWEFLLEKITDPVTGEIKKLEKITPNSQTFWREYSAREGSGRTTHSCAAHYRIMSENLHKMSFSLEMKANLYYALSISPDSGLIEEIKSSNENATPESDDVKPTC